MEKRWDVTITRIGALEILADSEDEAIEKAEKSIIENIRWEDCWNVVDICIAQ